MGCFQTMVNLVPIDLWESITQPFNLLLKIELLSEHRQLMNNVVKI